MNLEVSNQNIINICLFVKSGGESGNADNDTDILMRTMSPAIVMIPEETKKSEVQIPA